MGKLNRLTIRGRHPSDPRTVPGDSILIATGRHVPHLFYPICTLSFLSSPFHPNVGRVFYKGNLDFFFLLSVINILSSIRQYSLSGLEEN